MSGSLLSNEGDIKTVMLLIEAFVGQLKAKRKHKCLNGVKACVRGAIDSTRVKKVILVSHMCHSAVICEIVHRLQVSSSNFGSGCATSTVMLVSCSEA